MVRGEEGVDMIGGCGGCDGGDWGKESVLERVVDGRVYMREMCERCGEALRELHLMVQGFVWGFGPETCLLGTSPENLL